MNQLIEITPALLAELREKAEAATPGPWKRQGLAILLRYAQKHNGPWNDPGYVDCSIPLPEESDADYIAAANPDVVAKIVRELERLQGEVEILRQRIHEEQQ